MDTYDAVYARWLNNPESFWAAAPIERRPRVIKHPIPLLLPMNRFRWLKGH